MIYHVHDSTRHSYGSGRHSCRPAASRPGYVLIAVLIVIVVLSLVAYRFTDAMTSEYRAGIRTADMVQVRAAAASGIHYTAAMLASRDAFADQLGSNPFDNAALFSDVVVRTDPDNPKKDVLFSVVAVVPVAPGVYETRAGVIDEGGKLNINSMIAADATGEALYNALMKLPNMTEDVADAIVDWVDADDTPRTAGAESSYYQGLGNSYLCKNGALNTLDELLLVKGVTPQLLYGTDRNQNGIADDDGAALDRGWSDYLTVHGRELNVDSTGTLRVYINGDDLKAIYTALVGQGVDPEMAAYVVAAKLYGTTKLDANGNPVQSGGGARKKGNQPKPVRVGNAGDLIMAVETSLESASSSGKAINSVIDLMNTRVTLPKKSGTGGGQQQDTVVVCPLNDPTRLPDLLPGLLDKVATKEAVEMIPRVNAVTAPREVLLGLPGLDETDVDAILGAREGLTYGDPAATSAAWLFTAANLTPAKFKALEKYVTGSTMVYRIQAIGYLAGGGPVARIEAIIDTNQGAARILSYRELTDLDSPRAFQP